MKKQLLGGIIILALCACVACEKQDNTATAAADGGVSMVNPMKKYESIEALQEALGFKMPNFPEYYSMKEPLYFTIAQTLGEIQEKTSEGNDLTIRMQAGSAGDITGYYGVTFEEKELADTTVNVAADDTNQIAWWVDDTYSYAFIAGGLTEADFTSYLKELVNIANNQE